MSELKPCPFCADTPIRTANHTILCNGCHREFLPEIWESRPLEFALQQKYDALLSEVKAAMEEMRSYRKVFKPLLGISTEAVGADKAYEECFDILRRHIKEELIPEAKEGKDD